MHRKELNERSPLRVLERSIHGGLGRGNIGVVAARHGVGKTAFLVGIALDDLMRGRMVLHVSLEHPVDRVLDYYDEIFGDLARDRELENVWRVRLEMERHRRIHSYLDGSFSVERLSEALKFKREHSGFQPAAILIDGYAFSADSAADMQALRAVAMEVNAELWLSAVIHREAEIDEHGVPEPVSHVYDAVDVILRMDHDGENMHVGLLKDHDNPEVPDLRLALDPTTMLLIKK